MKIAVDYTNGRIKEFDLTIFTNNDAIRNGERASKNVTTELDLRLDRLEEDGLRLDLFWHDLAKANETVALDGVKDQNHNPMSAPQARKRVATTVKLLTPRELEGAARIIVERAQEKILVAWRQGSNKWLINGVLFDIQRQLTYNDANTISLNRQAFKTFEYLRRQADESVHDSEIAAMMGYPYEAYLEVLKQEYRDTVESNEELNDLTDEEMVSQDDISTDQLDEENEFEDEGKGDIAAPSSNETTEEDPSNVNSDPDDDLFNV